ncbi:hypothetical protein BD410DRAFT_418629 [Rickenella mellea]|uniref:Uncharacterized protein n=1 Tax=Rickenella mellea TaxID=50990 RepID=A0A4Y7QKP9_9AGAM|nr:hypothetical protein BD410DRAFT_418629 [Rickenella mellea]
MEGSTWTAVRPITPAKQWAAIIGCQMGAFATRAGNFSSSATGTTMTIDGINHSK